MNAHRSGDIYAEVSGPAGGSAVVLLHGNGESGRTMARQASFLARHYRVIVPDARGHGRSRRGDGPLTIARLADDAARVIGELAPRGRAHVIGYSDGANVAMELAIRHPGRVISLVLISGNLNPQGLSASSLRLMRAAEAVLSRLARFSSRAARRLEIWRLMTAEPDISPGQLSQVRVPALVLVGERDVIRPAHTRLIATSLPGARLEVVRGTGHRLIHAKAEEVNAAIGAFLARVEEKAASR